MRRMLLAVAVVALLGGFGVLAMTSLGPAPRLAGSSGAAGAGGTAVAASSAPVESGPFALAAERAARRAPDVSTMTHTHPDQDERTYVRRGSVDVDRGPGGSVRHLAEIAMRGLADRLDVDEQRLRSAAWTARSAALADGQVRDRATWDDRQRRALGAMARILDRPVRDVASATRNQLEHTLGLAVVFDVLTAKGRQLALDCWDAPQRCQMTALRLEIIVDERGRR